MCGGAVEFGKCEICGKEGPLERKYYYYGNTCECHSPVHFEIVRHCKDCKPKEPMETKVKFNTEDLRKTMFVDRDKFEHLLNCMANQKFIHEQSPEVQKEWQEIIDKAYDEARALLTKYAPCGYINTYCKQCKDYPCKEYFNKNE